MAYEISNAIKIAATPEHVWAVLADLDNYPQWHPAFQSVTGQLAAGSKLTIRTTSPSTGNPITLKVTVLTVEPGTELAWASKLLGVTTIKRRFLLRSADGGTELTQAGTYRGLGGSRGPGGARGALKTVANVEASYAEINEAVKKQAEARQQSLPAARSVAVGLIGLARGSRTGTGPPRRSAAWWPRCERPRALAVRGAVAVRPSRTTVVKHDASFVATGRPPPAFLAPGGAGQADANFGCQPGSPPRPPPGHAGLPLTG